MKNAIQLIALALTLAASLSACAGTAQPHANTARQAQYTPVAQHSPAANEVPDDFTVVTAMTKMLSFEPAQFQAFCQQLPGQFTSDRESASCYMTQQDVAFKIVYRGRTPLMVLFEADARYASEYRDEAIKGLGRPDKVSGAQTLWSYDSGAAAIFSVESGKATIALLTPDAVTIISQS